MYLDLDLHFSDAVSQAFAGSASGQILTLSVHHSAPGFFPVSHLAALPDPQPSDPYTLSIPLQRGASDKTFYRIWTNCVESVKNAFNPDFVVVQCGVDGLAGDPCGIWNWSLGASEGSFGWCISKILAWNCKTLFLGGGKQFVFFFKSYCTGSIELVIGGYDSPNVARAWSYISALAVCN